MDGSKVCHGSGWLLKVDNTGEFYMLDSPTNACTVKHQNLQKVGSKYSLYLLFERRVLFLAFHDI